MGNVMRLDKLLCMLGEGTRAQVKELVRAGRVRVGGEAARDAGLRVDAGTDEVALDGRVLS